MPDEEEQKMIEDVEHAHPDVELIEDHEHAHPDEETDITKTD